MASPAATGRARMVERQLRGRDITDPAVLAAMAAVPREEFVARHLRGAAYADRPLPIGEGQTISQPYIVALMAQLLELRPEDHVLEIGTGSGYAAAVLCHIAARVTTVERLAPLAEVAADRLRRLGYDNVHVVVGDGTLGWPADAPYDAILASAAGPRVPDALLEQLAPGGRLVIPVGPAGGQDLRRVRRLGPDHLEEEHLGGVVFVPLIGEQGWAP